MITKYLSPRNDKAFKRIFGEEKNSEILIDFLNEIVEREYPIKSVKFLKTAQDPELASLRTSIVDVMCEDQNKNRFIIEMQLGREKKFHKRALYYAAKAYCGQRTSKVDYKDLGEVYFLAITGFSPFKKKKHWLSRIGLKDLHTNEHDIKSLQLLFMQLPKFKKKKADLPNMSRKEKWAYFLKYAEDMTQEEVAKHLASDPIIEHAYKELDRFNWSEAELLEYEAVEMKQAADRAVEEENIEKGHKEGLKEGEKKKAAEIALNLLKISLPIEEIVKATGLRLENSKLSD